MPVKTYNNTKQGKPYASIWYEWHVDCAESGCECHATMAFMGEANSSKEAEKFSGEISEMKGWKKIKGFWYCSEHAAEAANKKTRSDGGAKP